MNDDICEGLRMLLLTVVSCFVSRPNLKRFFFAGSVNLGYGSFPLLLAGLTGYLLCSLQENIPVRS
jgi:hypothetical protein